MGWCFAEGVVVGRDFRWVEGCSCAGGEAAGACDIGCLDCFGVLGGNAVISSSPSFPAYD